MSKKLYGKIIVTGKISCVSGLHIGGAGGNLDIGGINNPILRDPLTYEPYIPGSSLKGKMRALFEIYKSKGICLEKQRHECSEENCIVCRLFGSISKDSNNIPSRLLVRDSFLTDDTKTRLEALDTDLLYAEWKTENNLHRITAKATPRHYERVPKGSEFNFEMVYNVEKIQDMKEDLTNILTILRLLEDDNLGGNGSRGHGMIEFSPIEVTAKKKEYYIDLDPNKILHKKIKLGYNVTVCDELIELFKDSSQGNDAQ